jgi:hypothetical protein
MCDVKVSLTFTSLSLVLLWQLFYLFCSSIVIHTVIVTAVIWTLDNSIIQILTILTWKWNFCYDVVVYVTNKGNNKITELRTILQREQEIHQSWSPIENRGKEKQSSLCLKINFSKNSERNRTRTTLQSLNKDRKKRKEKDKKQNKTRLFGIHFFK